MKKIQTSPNKIKYENPRDRQLFSKIVSMVLESKLTPKVDFPINVFGMRFQTFLFTTEMKDMISARVDYELYMFLYLVRFCCKSLYYIHDINK